MSKLKSLKLNFVMNTFKTIMTIIFPFISFPYVSRILGVNVIGTVSYTESIVNYFLLFSSLGISAYGTREAARCRDDKSRLGKLVTELFVINLITMTVSYAAFGIFLKCTKNSYVGLMVVQSMIIFLTTVGMEWFFVATEDYRYLSLASIVCQLLALATLFAFVKNPRDYIIYAGVVVFATVGSGAVNYIYISRKIQLFSYPNLNLKRHIKPILIIFGTNLASAIYLNLDITMLGLMRGNNDVGLYTAAVKLYRASTKLLGCVSAVILPRISYYLSQNLKQEVENLVTKAGNYVLMLAIPAGLGLIAVNQPLIILFSGAKFKSASAALSILAIGVVFATLNGMLAWQILVPFKKEYVVFYSTLAGAITNFVTNILLIPLFGIKGASFTTVLSEIVVFAICIMNIKKLVQIKGVFKFIYQYLVASGGMLLTIYFLAYLSMGELLSLAIDVIVGVTVYFIILAIFKNNYLYEVLELGMNRIKKKDKM
ncbi:flippase [Bacteroides sp.]|uniref:flippase n=1 Tax=Bacteroides sp. TaxID=29523 RepID=UPI00261E49AB|nr:flippase [Bacteroides sp.]MDD3040489.1 flippase [Bacteroides sp.]